jgi:hypothetical protein
MQVLTVGFMCRGSYSSLVRKDNNITRAASYEWCSVSRSRNLFEGISTCPTTMGVAESTPVRRD